MTEQTQTDPAATAAAAPVPKPRQKLTLGRIVHHRNSDGHTHAALVTKVHKDGAASLHVFPDDAPSHLVHAVPEVDPPDASGATPTDSGWHWPVLA